MKEKKFTWKDALPSIIAGGLFISQMLYGGFFITNNRIDWIKYIGIGVFILSGIFGIIPVIIFPKKGGVTKGKSFVYTTKLVDTGFYAIVRHPQYSAFILWAIGASLLFQNWIVIILGIPVIILTYYDMMQEDKRNIEKFGDNYREYMKQVPRANFLYGIIKAIYKK
jgi:protein-S-isoprenylcysteine O-methyltransferase Ste14